MRIPESHCHKHQFPLTIEREPGGRGPEAWRCYCSQCEDYDDEAPNGRLHEVGYGRDPSDAIDSLAENLGIATERLLFQGERHI